MARARGFSFGVAVGAEFETIAVQAVLTPTGGFTRDGLVITTGGDHGIMIEEGCSAFQNVSLASLIWLSLVKLDTLTIRPRMSGSAPRWRRATVTLNTIRLALMAQSPSMYNFWHNGGGVSIVIVHDARWNALDLPGRPLDRWPAVSSSAGFRFAFAVVTLGRAGWTCVASRSRVRAPSWQFVGVEALNMSPGQPFGRGTFEGTVDEGVPGVRLRAGQCGRAGLRRAHRAQSGRLCRSRRPRLLSHPGYSTTMSITDRSARRSRISPGFSPAIR